MRIQSLLFIFLLSCFAIADDSNNGQQVQDDEPAKPLSKEELREKLARGRLEKKIESAFRKTKLVSNKRSERAHIDDLFVVAKFQLPLETRAAELRFEVVSGVKPSTTKMADYLLTTPENNVRDFKVISRFKSAAEADAGLAHVRQQYDQAVQYQKQMLAYLQQQYALAKSMTRC